MATGKDRERRLARERYERNLAKRERNRERAHRRHAIVAATAGVVIVLGGGSALVATLGLPGGSGAQAESGSAGAHKADAAGPSAAAQGPSCSYSRIPEEQRGKNATFVGMPPPSAKPDTDYKTSIETNRGEIVINMLNNNAPCTVNSFRFLASKDFYDETACHRLVTTGIHVLQCGDPSGTGRGGPGYSFGDESLEEATYPRGTVAMAIGGPDTNGSQFFIVYEKGGLAPKYTPFGKVIKGLDIVDEIAAAGVAEDGVAPKKKVVIEDVEVSQRH